MVQLGDNASCNRAMANLNNCYIFNSRLALGSVHIFIHSSAICTIFFFFQELRQCYLYQ